MTHLSVHQDASLPLVLAVAAADAHEPARALPAAVLLARQPDSLCFHASLDILPELATQLRHLQRDPSQAPRWAAAAHCLNAEQSLSALQPPCASSRQGVAYAASFHSIAHPSMESLPLRQERTALLG